MKLTVVSHKECWRDPGSPSGFVTHGGFPMQMQAISQAFDETVLALPVWEGVPPPGLLPLVGHNLRVQPLTPSYGEGTRRQLAVLRHLPVLLPQLWRAISESDAVHVVVPGDIGTLGLAMAIARRRRTVVRYCGIWGSQRTVTERFLIRTLERHAGGNIVVFATGGAPTPPSSNPAIEWIFSTSMRNDELRDVPQARSWRPGTPLELVTVNRLDPGKNVGSTLDAIAYLRKDGHDVRFTVVGDGSMGTEWKRRASELGLTEVVRFVGRVDHQEVLAILGRSHLFVFPTNAEGFPKALHEAMACGLPVVASRVSVIPELLGTGGGMLLEDTSPGSIERAIRSVIADPEMVRRMAVLARATSLEFTLERWRDTIAARCERAWSSPTRSTA